MTTTQIALATMPELLLEIEQIAEDFEPELVGYQPADIEEATVLLARLEAQRDRFDAAYDDYRAGLLA